MYRIIKQLDGKYLALCNIQDGTERSTHSSKEEATKRLIGEAKILNGTTITEQEIKFGTEIQRVVSDVVWEEKPQGHCCHCKH